MGIIKKLLKKAVVKAAETYLEKNELNDPEKYLRHMTYTETIVNPFLTQREWYFEYIDNACKKGIIILNKDYRLITDRFNMNNSVRNHRRYIQNFSVLA